ncbi:hypothetical protein Tsubulata_049165 [Turnera subulata]|uniref:NAD-dependent epimerase/dehydratase domain-containing protein n=1 Tax=Turnera subulata TaxID=218843 RepID=A0A9Q0FVV6_9ROSI|nr:hypothetical protein Tsubulata_049165 [Turnera subulata]
MEGMKGPVCVTGATGYVASWLVMRLLEQGYSVNATVRSDPERKKDISYITNLPGASDKLKIFNADLSQPDSFKAAIEGCIGVFHVAHPMEFEGKQHEEVITKMAVDGLLGILRSCLDSKTVKRFVYTSTAATVMFNGKGLTLVDENTWSDLDICRSNEFSFLTPYYVSKTLTEKTALEFAETNGLELVTVILPLVVGPFIFPAIPASVALALGFILGYQKQYIGRNNWNMVHIDDAIRAHIYLLENSEAKGRDRKETEESAICRLSSKKLLDLGFTFQFGLNEMFDGAIQCCKDNSFL